MTIHGHTIQNRQGQNLTQALALECAHAFCYQPGMAQQMGRAPGPECKGGQWDQEVPSQLYGGFLRFLAYGETGPQPEMPFPHGRGLAWTLQGLGPD